MPECLKPAASYARISDKVERDKVADQHRQNERHAKARGYVIVAWFTDDGISGLGHKLRQGFRDMLAAAERGKFQVIIATEEERLARNVEEKLELHAACEDFGVVWDTDRDGFVDPSTDSGEFMSTIRAAVGRIESKRKARRQLAAAAERINEGLPVAGRRRFGYLPGNIDAQPDEAEQVKVLFRDFLAGTSVRTLATRMGWTTRRVRDTLTNPSYAGWVVRRGERFEAHPSVARLIERKTFEDVQALLNAPGRRTSPGPAPRHVLSGLARCGRCGGPMSFRNAYLCLSDLSHPTIKKETLEDYVRQRVVEVLLFGYFEELPEASRVHEIDRRQIEIEAAKTELIESLEHGVKAQQIAPSLQRLEAENVQLSAERERIVAGSIQLAVVADLRNRIFDMRTRRASLTEAVAVKQNLAQRFDARTFEEKRELIRGLVSIQVHNGRGVERVDVLPLVSTVHELEAPQPNSSLSPAMRL